MAVTTAAETDDLLAAARSLAELIESEAGASEGLGTLSEAVVQAFRDRGLLSMLVPRELGGGEAGVVTALEVIEEVTRADASTGWTLLANASTSAMAGSYLGERAVEAMFGARRPVTHAGQFAPRGHAWPTEHGYVVAGSYSFGSGSGHAEWIGGGTLELRDGAPALVDGRPVIRAFFVPRDKVVFRGGWDVMGLVGTGSYDYDVPEQEVDADFTFSITDPVARRGGPFYHLGVLGITSLAHAGFAMGAGKRALQEVIALAGTKQRMGQPATVATQERFQYDLGHHDAATTAARAGIIEAFTDAEHTLQQGAELSAVQAQRLRQCTTYATHVARDVVRFAYHWAGTDSLRPGVLQRLFRDTHAATQHIFVDDSTLTQMGRLLLG